MRTHCVWGQPGAPQSAALRRAWLPSPGSNLPKPRAAALTCRSQGAFEVCFEVLKGPKEELEYFRTRHAMNR